MSKASFYLVAALALGGCATFEPAYHTEAARNRCIVAGYTGERLGPCTAVVSEHMAEQAQNDFHAAFGAGLAGAALSAPQPAYAAPMAPSMQTWHVRPTFPASAPGSAFSGHYTISNY